MQQGKRRRDSVAQGTVGEVNREGLVDGFTPALPPIVLAGAAMLANGTFQFPFTNTPGATFTMLAATNAALPLANWDV